MYEQIYSHFSREIHTGRLAQGERLPSKRALCAHLGVSRSTVETAYGMLVAEGYVRAREKSGYYVSDFLPLLGENSLQTDVRPAEACTNGADAGGKRPRFDFSTASVDTSLFPYSSWAKLNKEVFYSSPELLQRGDRQGDMALRSALAAFLSEYRGVKCAPEQIVVGAGMEYLTGLLVQLLPPDTVYGVEDPGYSSIRHTLSHSGRTLSRIPLDEKGMIPGALEKSGASTAYITPSHQFPMGVTMPADRRSHILRWAENGPERFVIEDDYDSEFRYSSRPVPAMQGMAGTGRVIYIGTFSRSIAPSIRIAYMVLPVRLYERYMSLFSHSLSTVSRYEQAVVARFLAEGYYSRYLRRVGNLYRQRCETLVSALKKIDGVSVSGEGAGIHFLVKNERFSERELTERALREGIRLHGLSEYCSAFPAAPSTIVMGYGGLSESLIPEAAELLRKAWS